MSKRTTSRKRIDLTKANPQGRVDVLAARAVDQFIDQYRPIPAVEFAFSLFRPFLHQSLRSNLGPRALPDITAALRAQSNPKQRCDIGPKKPAFESRAAALAVLELPATATKAEVKTAYRNLCTQYHPDKVMGLAPAFQKLADSKMKELNAAYRFLKGGKR